MVVIALNILRNGFLLQVTDTHINDVHDALCTYFLRFHSVLLQAVNESVCLNNEGKYAVKTKADVYNMPQRDIIFRTTKNAHIL